ncbi:hypothetical protein [Burkholderia latens]|uniref:ATP-binding protein n=1 Tax=Burkholderia latens TaxID=488446 RepID=A0A6H9T2B6_9BURK|nr:hypothetical protein [Burkholderia latens]KAB0642898.1 hypothetical protein F7R21_09980 [Burkholderia latens]VWB83940.1 hypothetical protein BLA24064_03963 [Burkholderia latens]
MLDRIIDGLELRAQHTRSISLSRDLHDEAAIASYLPTPNAVQALKQIGSALANDSAQRAWKVVGPYGSGKSALGIVLAQLLQGPSACPAVHEMLGSASASVANLFASSNRFPMAVVGARLSIGLALGTEIHRSLARWPNGKGVSGLKKQLSEPGYYKGRPINAVAGELMRDFCSVVSAQGFDGTVLLIDEVGKFVEHAAMHPDAGDLIALQQLAEEACRPNDDSLALVVMQHQHFASYAAGIGRALDDEWHKVASRFEEIPFDEPVERYAHFAAHALGVKPALYRDSTLAQSARAVFDIALEQDILRAPTSADKRLFQHPEKLYPLHPLTLAALAIISKRYGQSERSFHAFLNSNEPAGLRDFAQVAPVDGHPWYRLTEVFDYLASGHGLRFRDLAAERRWAFAVTAIDRQGNDADAPAALKTIAVLELVQASLRLRITPELVAYALGQRDVAETKERLDCLVSQGLLIRRHNRSEYGFAVSEAVNIEALYDDAAQITEGELVVRGATHVLGSRFVIANRHYDRRGTIRTLAIDVGTVSAWPVASRKKDSEGQPDGWLRLLLVTAGSKEQREALDRIRGMDDPLSVYCCLALSSQGRAALAELAIWLTVQQDVTSKRLDPWTSQYVDSRLHQAKEDVDAVVFSALAAGPGIAGPVYWYQGKVIPHCESMNVNQVASWLFETVFKGAPRIVNELINKDRPASAVVLARQRLVDLLLAGPTGKSVFGDKEFPPERLIHATLVRDTGIWEIEGNNWKLVPPRKGATVDISVVWAEISRVMTCEEAPTFEQVLRALAAPPFGVRNGPASVWVTLYLLIHRNHCAIFERGTLVLELTSEYIQRMYKNPHTFQLRELPQGQDSVDLLRDYGSVLSSLGAAPTGEVTYLALARSLYRWFGQLSDFAKQTGRISKDAVLVRTRLGKAQDPIELLTTTLPQAHQQSKASSSFVEWLSLALTDLGMSQRKLQETVAVELGRVFGIAGQLGRIRSQLQAECSGAATGLADARLKSFILRCTDVTLTDEKWLDSVASLLVQRPLDTWGDETIENFAQAATEIGGHYRRWLRLVMQRKGAPRAAERFVSVTLTGATGQESALFVAKSEHSARLARSILDLLEKQTATEPHTAAAALAEALQGLNVMQIQLNSTKEKGHDEREAG